MVPRYLQKTLEQDLRKGKTLILYGPRQVGKTTLVKEFMTAKTVMYNCDQEEVRRLLTTTNLATISRLIKPYDRIIIDEAQRVRDIGLTLKLMIDNFSDKQILVTGSSALDLSSTIIEPLTGRHLSYCMYPISLGELATIHNPVEMREQLEDRLIFGSYPEIVTTESRQDKEQLIRHLIDSAVLKDVLAIETIKQPRLILDILQAIALQLGGEVSYEEIAALLGLHKQTVKKYLDLCEQIFLLTSLRPYTTNKRNSVRKKRKYYFFDLGLRNGLVNNFNSLNVRADVGALWENFCVLERLKHNAGLGRRPNYYFWRSYSGAEIDLIEESGGVLNGFEMKYNKDRTTTAITRAFADIGGSALTVVNKENIFSTLLDSKI